jgi:uncharacterized protein YbaP (TraB family)
MEFIVKKDGEVVAGLFGTVHVEAILHAGMVLNRVLEKYAKAYFEIDLENSIQIDENNDFLHLYSEEFVNNIVKELGEPAKRMLQIMSPHILAVAGVVSPEIQKQLEKQYGEINIFYPVDVTAYKMAKELGKDINFLETGDSQIEATFGHMTLERVVGLIESTYNDYATQAHIYEQKMKLLEAYESDDLEKVKESMSDKAMMSSPALSEEESDEMLEKMFTKRDEEFLKKIEASIETKENAVFFVGIGHLSGTAVSKGLIKLLEERGYEVEFVGRV